MGLNLVFVGIRDAHTSFSPFTLIYTSGSQTEGYGTV